MFGRKAKRIKELEGDINEILKKDRLLERTLFERIEMLAVAMGFTKNERAIIRNPYMTDRVKDMLIEWNKLIGGNK